MFSRPRPISGREAVLALTALLPLSLSGCGAEAVELAQEISEARGECTAEGLRHSDEECVRMMGRYAEMGTELVHTYLGGLRALDRALERVPPQEFDTVGVGYAISPEYRLGDPAGAGASPRLMSGILRNGAGESLPGGRSIADRGIAAEPQIYEGWDRPGATAVGRPATRGEIRSRRDRPLRSAPPDAGPGARATEPMRFRWEYGDGGYGGRRPYGDEVGWRRDGYGRVPFGYRDYGAWSPFGYWDFGGWGAAYPGYDHLYGRRGGYRYGYGYGRGDVDPYGYDTGRWGYGDPGWYGYDQRWDPYGYGAPYGDGRPGFPGSADLYGYGYEDRRGRYGDDPRDPYGRDVWEDPQYRHEPGYDDLPPEEAWGYDPGDAPPEVTGDPPASGGVAAAAEANPVPPRPAPHRPGILLPPEQRLRRPWLND